MLVIDNSSELRNEIALALVGEASVATLEPTDLALIGAVTTVHRPAVVVIGDIGSARKLQLIREIRRRSARSRMIVVGAADAREANHLVQLGACCVVRGAVAGSAAEKAREYLSYGPRTTGLIDRRNGVVQYEITDDASSGAHYH